MKLRLAVAPLALSAVIVGGTESNGGRAGVVAGS